METSLRTPRGERTLAAISCLLAAIISAAGLGRVANAAPSSKQKQEINLRWHRARFGGNRKVSISPRDGTGGIPDGLVIAYGHVIPPPYLLESSNGRLMVNGVQVQPSLLLGREQPLHRSTLTQAQIEQGISGHRLVARARILFSEDFGKKPIGDVHAEITSLIRDAPKVFKNPIWPADDELQVQSAVDGGFEEIEFSKQPPMSDEAQKRLEMQQAARAVSHHIEILRKVLAQGQTVVFRSDGGESHLRSDVRGIVKGIMTNPRLTAEQRIELLTSKVFFGDYEPAFDVIDNYDPTEWKVK